MTAAPSAPIARARCFLHPGREAAARCVGCGQSFCRECVTALDQRMFCAACYKAKAAGPVKHRRDWFVLSISFQLLLGLLGLWLTAYFLGRVLVELPTGFHEGTIWEKMMP